MVKDFMAKGYSFEAFAGSIGTHKQVVYEWRERNQDFGDAVKEAFDLCRIKWESMALDHVYMTGQNEKFNAVVWLFNMKNRFGWRDQQNLEISGKVTLEDLVAAPSSANPNKEDG